MNRHFLLLLVLLLSVGSIALAQSQPKTTSVAVTSVPAIEPAFLKLLNDNIALRKDSILNEELLDLVWVKEADSILTRKSQRHRSGFGWLLAPFGIKWKAITMQRQKYIGTAKKDIGNPDKPEYTEYDININLIAHTPKYMACAWQGLSRQKHINKKNLRGRDPNKPPFVEPTLETCEQYHIHCELTPPKDYRKKLHELFYPIYDNIGFTGHQNFGEPRPSVGVYGPFVLDCNHNCHPEIHPYEWIWWLDVNPAKDSIANEKRWMVGLMREGSNRFRKWSTRPRVGLVSVPFVFSVDELNPTITIEHLVCSSFMEKELKTLPELPAATWNANFTEMHVALSGTDGKSLTILTNQGLDTEGLKMWLSGLKTDGKWIQGHINIAISVADVYTARITVNGGGTLVKGNKGS